MLAGIEPGRAQQVEAPWLAARIVAGSLLATILAKGDDIDGAAAVLEQLAELEPYDAEVHKQLLTAWLRLGRRTEAARRYTSFRMRMLREFGEEPDFELADLTQTAARARSI